MTTLIDLIGIHDNLDEAPDFFNHPQNILGVVISFMVVSWTCALLRLYTRFFIVRSPGCDDLFIVITLLFTSVGSITICLAVIYGGMGTHYITLEPDTMRTYLKILYVDRMFPRPVPKQYRPRDGRDVLLYVANGSYPLSTGCIKLALLFQYLRLYQPGTWLYKTTIFSIVIVALWSTAFAVMAWIPTVPVRAYWDYSMPATRYGFGTWDVEDFIATFISLTGSNMALDILILGLAAPLLLRQHYHPAPARSRWCLVALFGVGSLASIFSVLRLGSLVDTSATTSPTFDPTWYGSTPIVYAALEVDIATITASLPVFWPVFRDLQLSQILVTREFKVTLEHRRLSTSRTGAEDPDDEAIELQRSKSGLQRTTRSDYYSDPYIAQQVNPFERAEFGVKSGVDCGESVRTSCVEIRR